ncbi:MAG: WD40 repeat domain-containing protein, partial [Planctomycetes bacterium]|nr:WD40 repeat domain-containing protein [Planctomycetota bacterium]
TSSHSIFARYFLKALEDPPARVFVPSDIFPRIRDNTALNAPEVERGKPQTPILGVLKEAGHEVGGEFVFFYRGALAPPPPPVAPPASPTTDHPTPTTVVAPPAPTTDHPQPKTGVKDLASLPPKPSPPTEPPKPPIPEKPSPKPGLDTLVIELANLMAARRYDDALSKCRQARNEPALAGLGKELGQWEESIGACGRVMDAAREQGKSLVGKKYKMEVKVGAKGRAVVPADVLKFENDTLVMQVGAKETQYPLTEVGPSEILRLASTGKTLSLRDRLDQAVFLFAEGSESDGLGMARSAEEAARRDESLRDAAKSTVAFLTDWAERNVRREKERRATQLIKKAAEHFEAKKWANVVDGVEKLKKDFADTETCRRESENLASLVEKAKQEAQKFTFWKFLGETVPVPGPGGKLEELPAGVLTDLKYSPDGKYLAVAHSFGVDLYDARRRTIVRRLDGHVAAVWSIDFSPNSSRLITGSCDATAVLWEVPSGKQVWKFQAARALYSVAFAPDGRQVACAGSGTELSILDSLSGERHVAIGTNSPAVYGLAFSRDGHRVFGACDDKMVRIWDAKRGDQIACLDGHTNEVKCVAFSPDGKLIASGSEDGAVMVWDAATKQPRHVFKLGGPSAEGVLSLSFSRDGALLAAAGYFQGAIALLNPAKGLEVWRGKGAYGRGVSFSADGQFIAAGMQYRRPITIHHAASGREMGKLHERAMQLSGADFSPGDPNLLVGSGGGQLPRSFIVGGLRRKETQGVAWRRRTGPRRRV